MLAGLAGDADRAALAALEQARAVATLEPRCVRRTYRALLGVERPLDGILDKTVPEHGAGMIEDYGVDLAGRRSQHAADHLPVQPHFLGRSGENAAGDFR